MGLTANVLKFDLNKNVEDFTFVLSTKNYKHLGQLNNVKRDTVHFKNKFNGVKELSFEVFRIVDEDEENLWDKIVDFKSIYVPELEEYFEIKVTHNDILDEKKVITGISLCEAELSQVNLYEFEVNTDIDIEKTDYVPTIFYDEENPNSSLIHRTLDKMPQYSIRHIDDSLKKLQRTFSVNGTSIYDFFTGECAEQFNCIFIFHSKDRSISIYDLYTVCNNCGHRSSYNDICPECGSTFLNYYGEDTTVYVDKENLSDDITLTVDTDSVKNCFRLSAGDDDMTAAIVDLNQNGTPYMYYFSSTQKEDMSEELVEKIESYDELYNSYTEEYEGVITQLRQLTDDILYYTSGMIPGDSTDDSGNDANNTESIAKREATKLEDNLNTVGFEKLNSSISSFSIDNAVLSYAKIYANTGYVKLSINSSTYNYNDDGTGTWVGTIKVTNWSDDKDIVITNNITVNIIEDYSLFIEQTVMKDIALNEKEYSIFNVLEEDDLDTFKSHLESYCLVSLCSFEDSLNSAISALAANGQGSSDSELYEDFYVPYVEKRDACTAEITVRTTTISALEVQKAELYIRKAEIQDELNFENYLGTKLYNEFSSYRRESEYNNSNYIVDGLSEPEIMAKAKEFLETAKKELIQSATSQCNISANLYNLLVIDGFEAILDKFALGNFIRVRVGDNIYRLRLIEYEINFGSLDKLPVQFSDMTITTNGLNDVRSILQSAEQMSSNFAYVSKQAEKGKDANDTFEKMYQEGLNSALWRIKNNINEDIVFDKRGLILRSWDDVLNDYSPEQALLTHNCFTYTTDNFRTVTSALGKHNYYKFNDNHIISQYTDYGLTAKFVTAGVINSSQMVSGKIYSSNYVPKNSGTYINLDDGTFEFAGGNLKYDGSDLSLTGKIIALAGGKVGGWDIGKTSIYNKLTSMNDTSTIGTYIGTDGIRQNGKNASVIIQNGILTAKGGVFEGTVNAKDGSFTGSITSSNINVDGGKIGGWTIGSTYMGSTHTDGSVYITSAEDRQPYWFRTHDANSNLTFYVSKTGKLYANNIEAIGGTIGGCSLNSQGIFYNNGSTGFGIWGTTAHSNIAIHAGSNSSKIGSAPFRVYHSGSVVADNFASASATITGGSFKVGSNSSTDSRINVTYSQYQSNLAAYQIQFDDKADGSGNTIITLGLNGLTIKKGTTTVFSADLNGSVIINGVNLETYIKNVVNNM